MPPAPDPEADRTPGLAPERDGETDPDRSSDLDADHDPGPGLVADLDPDPGATVAPPPAPGALPTGSAEPRAAPATARRAGRRRRGGRSTVALYTAAAMLGAALVFLTQPMVVKMVLPRLGGSPSVWNTAMVFFQAVLLAGYGYAHLSASRLGLRRQVAVHLLVLALPLAVLPMGLPEGWRPPGEGTPVGWLVWVLAAVAGFPYFVVTTSSPLLQRWFSVSGHRLSPDPYFLYAAGNAGSIAGLVAYPVLLEPNLSLSDQAHLWTAGYLLFAVLSAAAAFGVLRRSPRRCGRPGPAPGPTGGAAAAGAPHHVAAPGPAGGAATRAPTSGFRRWAERLRWTLLAFVPSSLLLGVTTSLSTDVAAVPLLWVVPLAVYLLTSILAFARHRLVPVGLASALTPVVVALVAATMLARAPGLAGAAIVVQMAGLFLVGVLCHGRLADSRPPPDRLTEFFLCASVGGVAGGAFNALVAPLLFDRVLELPIALAGALLLRLPPRARAGRHRTRPGFRRRLAGAALPLVAGLAVGLAVPQLRSEGTVAVVAACVVVAVVTLPRRLAAAVALSGLLGYATVADDGSARLRRRTFFGVLVVREDAARTTLSHGTTLHGSQLRGPGLGDVPTTYYHRSGPLGQVFDAYRSSPVVERVGVVGLGAGTVAAYATPARHLTFFEIDAAVVDIARDPRYFTYLSRARERSGRDVDVVLGDARLSLGASPEGRFGLLVLDAFSSDAIPVHLLTREAVEAYLRTLRPGGLLLVHVSNRWLRLEGPVAAIAEDLGLHGRLATDGAVTPQQRQEHKTVSSWIALARHEADLSPLRDRPGWRPLQRQAGVGTWTDDFSNVVEVLRWRWWR